MPDYATSADPDVQAQLDRLTALSSGADILGLDRITRLLARLGDPHLALPPVFHVAGTNGKGSTCAFLRAALEAEGRSVHVFTSPHLVRFNERIRLNGALISDPALAAYLARVLDQAAGIGPSFFEVTTAAALLAFTEHAADACIVEVGLGGRLDATNVLQAPAACGIAQLGIDHQSFLGDTIEQIAAEKAGIAKAGTPLLTMTYPTAVAGVIGATAQAADARWLAEGRDWSFSVSDASVEYRDRSGCIPLPLPTLPGTHQAGNLALATAMLRHQTMLNVSEPALKAAASAARWPARLEPLRPGPLTAPVGGRALWLDGGHNPAAGAMLARHFAGQRLALIAGMLDNKDVSGFLTPLAGLLESVEVVPVPGHGWHPAESFAAALPSTIPVHLRPDLPTAIESISGGDGEVAVLICGSLYLAGEALRLNQQLPE